VYAGVLPHVLDHCLSLRRRAFGAVSPIRLLVGNVIEHLDYDTNDSGCSLLKFRGTHHLYRIHLIKFENILISSDKSLIRF